MPEARDLDGVSSNNMQITSYETLESNGGFTGDERFLVARYTAGSGDYYNVSWRTILSIIDTKATAVKNPDYFGAFGLVSVNTDGIVTSMRRIISEDLPMIPLDKIENLEDRFNEKIDKSIANDSNGTLLGEIYHSIDESLNEVTVSEKYLDVNGEKLPEIKNTVIFSDNDSLTFKPNARGIDIQVNPKNAQVKADWLQNLDTEPDYIKNKPDLKPVATTGSYNDLIQKPTFMSSNTDALEITVDSNNQYEFIPKETATWGKINGTLSDQGDLSEKFSKYYSIEEMDKILADLNVSILKVKGYMSSANPETIFPDKIINGTYWLETSAETSPVNSKFDCKQYNEESGTWETAYYQAKNFDVWINVNGTDNSWFWLENLWEKLDFNVDLTKYYTKIELDNLLAQKQNNLKGKEGDAVFVGAKEGEFTTKTLSDVAFSGSFEDLSNKPPLQVQTDWDETDDRKASYLMHKPTVETFQADWNLTDTATYGFIKNKPTIPTLVHPDFTEENQSSFAYIKHKPNPSYNSISNGVTWNNTATFATNMNFNGTTTTFNLPVEIYNRWRMSEVYYNGIKLTVGDDYTFSPTYVNVPMNVGENYEELGIRVAGVVGSSSSSWNLRTDKFILAYNQANKSLTINYTDTGETVNLITGGEYDRKNAFYSLQPFVVEAVNGTIPTNIIINVTGSTVKFTFAPDTTDTIEIMWRDIELDSWNYAED